MSEILYMKLKQIKANKSTYILNKQKNINKNMKEYSEYDKFAY